MCTHSSQRRLISFESKVDTPGFFLVVSSGRQVDVGKTLVQRTFQRFPDDPSPSSSFHLMDGTGSPSPNSCGSGDDECAQYAWDSRFGGISLRMAVALHCSSSNMMVFCARSHYFLRWNSSFQMGADGIDTCITIWRRLGMVSWRAAGPFERTNPSKQAIILPPHLGCGRRTRAATRAQRACNVFKAPGD